jgi:hypothetical protein
VPVFKRGDLPEPPPAGWDQLGLHPGYTLRMVPPADVDRLCREAGVSQGDYGRGRFGACVDLHGKQVILPEGMDPEKDAATKAHEFSHTWGATHGNRHRGWFGADGKPLQPLTPEMVRLMRSMAEGEVRMSPPRGLMGSSARQSGAQ